MVCPNCKSTEIIGVQGQLFCINCGQAVPDAVVKAAASAPAPTDTPQTSVSAAASVPEPVKRRRKPGRPKAGKLDVPKPGVTPTPVAGAAVPRIHHTAPRRRLDDIRRPAAEPATESEAAQPAKPVAEHEAPIGFGPISGHSWHDRFQPVALGWAAWPAALLALMAGAVTWVLIGHRTGQAWQLTVRAGWPLWGELIIIAVLYYVSHGLVQAAIIYGAARRADHRSVPWSRQLAAAVNSFGSRTGFDIVVLLLQLSIAVLGGGLVIAGGIVWPVPDYIQVAGLFLAFMVLLYAFIGLGFVLGLGRVALTLSGLNLPRAFGLSWRFYRRHFELTGFKVVSLLLELLLLLPLLALVVALAVYLPANLRWLTGPAAVLLTLGSGAIIGAGTAIWWQAAYRALVQAGRPGEVLPLLAGRRAERPHRGAAVLVSVVLILLGLAAAAWPWVGQYL